MIALLAGVVACSKTDRSRPGSSESSGVANADTVDILEAVWRVAVAGNSARRVSWLYLPESDTSALTTSSDVRNSLIQRGVPASARLPIGDDTVTFRVRHWSPESDTSSLIEVVSSWSTVIGLGTQRCRQISGNVESYRALRMSRGWTAERVGSVAHGDSVCRPAS